MPRRSVDIAIESFPLAIPFRISRALRRAADVVCVTLTEDGVTGRGEGRPIERYGESCASAHDEIAAVAGDLAAGLDRPGIDATMRPGAARNAVDCALWDLDAKRAGTTVWALAGRARPDAIETAFSLSLDRPTRMARAAANARRHPLLKLKLGGDGQDVARIAAVRDARSDARLIADANEALLPRDLPEVIDAALRFRLEMIEQPLPADRDRELDGIAPAALFCADESCHTTHDLDRLCGRYGMINIKLDKTGGLTEALRLETAARAAGFKVMVGCMFSTSLGIAPAQIVAAGADLVDLDAPLYLAADRDSAITYDGAAMRPADPALWG
jgi:L-alanine-DL-glutamate epimerase-like enolase superfamily enzyme